MMSSDLRILVPVIQVRRELDTSLLGTFQALFFGLYILDEVQILGIASSSFFSIKQSNLLESNLQNKVRRQSRSLKNISAQPSPQREDPATAQNHLHDQAFCLRVLRLSVARLAES